MTQYPLVLDPLSCHSQWVISNKDCWGEKRKQTCLDKRVVYQSCEKRQLNAYYPDICGTPPVLGCCINRKNVLYLLVCLTKSEVNSNTWWSLVWRPSRRSTWTYKLKKKTQLCCVTFWHCTISKIKVVTDRDRHGNILRHWSLCPPTPPHPSRHKILLARLRSTP